MREVLELGIGCELTNLPLEIRKCHDRSRLTINYTTYYSEK
jgi:hypothetical protein